MRDALRAPFKNLLVKAPVTIEQYTAAPGPCKVASAVPFRGHRLTRETVSMVAPSYWSQTLRSAYWGRLSVGDLVALGTRWSLVGPLREPGRNLDGQPDNDLFSLVCCPVAIVRVFKFWLTTGYFPSRLAMAFRAPSGSRRYRASSAFGLAIRSSTMALISSNNDTETSAISSAVSSPGCTALFPTTRTTSSAC